MPTPQQKRLLLANQADIVRGGLVSEYRFTEGVGSSLTDYTGGNAVTLTGSPTWGADGLTFSGSGQYGSDGTGVLTGLTAFHICAVARSALGSVQTITAKESDWRLQFTATQARVLFWSGGATTSVSLASGVSANTWLFLDGWRNGTELGIRPNAGTATTGTMGASATSTTTNKFGIGAYIDGSNNPNELLNGRIAYILLYNRKLADSEVAQNYSVLKAKVAARGITLP